MGTGGSRISCLWPLCATGRNTRACDKLTTSCKLRTAQRSRSINVPLTLEESDEIMRLAGECYASGGYTPEGCEHPLDALQSYLDKITNEREMEMIASVRRALNI